MPFIYELCVWLSLLDPLLSRIVREIADTFGPDHAQITVWETALGKDVRAVLYHIPDGHKIEYPKRPSEILRHRVCTCH